MYQIIIFILLGLYLSGTTVFCYQPQSGSLPRWSKGIGLQTGVQNQQFERQNDALYWVEGAYSFTRWLGITKRVTSKQSENKSLPPNKHGNYNSLKITVPVKFFFDEESVTWNSFIIPALIYYLPYQKWQGGTTVGLFRESFYTYFTLAFTYLNALSEVTNPKQDYALKSITLKSDLGFHLYYNEQHLTGLWALVTINLHRDYFLGASEVYHLTVEPTLLAYFQATTLILRYAHPLWQYNNYANAEDRANALLKGGFEIGLATAF